MKSDNAMPTQALTSVEAPVAAQEPLEAQMVAATENEVAAAPTVEAAVQNVTEQVQSLSVDDASVVAAAPE